jgi:hypothetical protein
MVDITNQMSIWKVWKKISKRAERTFNGAEHGMINETDDNEDGWKWKTNSTCERGTVNHNAQAFCLRLKWICNISFFKKETWRRPEID